MFRMKLTLEARDHHAELADNVFKMGKITTMVRAQNQDGNSSSGVNPTPITGPKPSTTQLDLEVENKILREDNRRTVLENFRMAGEIKRLKKIVAKHAEGETLQFNSSMRQAPDAAIGSHEFTRILI